MSDKLNNFFEGLCNVALGVGYGLKISSIGDQILELIPNQKDKILASKLLKEYRDTLEELYRGR